MWLIGFFPPGTVTFSEITTSDTIPTPRQKQGMRENQHPPLWIVIDDILSSLMPEPRTTPLRTYVKARPQRTWWSRRERHRRLK